MGARANAASSKAAKGAALREDKRDGKELRVIGKRLIWLGTCLVALAGSAAAQTVTGSGTSGTVPVFNGTSSVTNSPITVSGSNVGAPSMNNICIAVNQHTSNAGTDIAACIAALGGNAGIVDATGYTGNQTIAGLTVSAPVTIELGAANFNFTGVLNATNINPTSGGSAFVLEGVSGTVLTGNTGSGKPLIDLMGTSGAKIRDLYMAAGTDCPAASSTTNPSTIGILQGRTATNIYSWRTHLEDVEICIGSSTPSANYTINQVFSTSATLTSGSNVISAAVLPTQTIVGEWLSGTGIPSGTTVVSDTGSTITMSNAATSSGAITLAGFAGPLGIYNYGAENTHYENVTVVAGVPITLTAINIYNVTPPDVPFYTGLTTMESTSIDGKSDLYGANTCAVFVAAAQTFFDPAECDGTGSQGTYGVIVAGHSGQLHIWGEYENFPRAIYQNGFAVSSDFDFSCAACVSAPGWTGTMSTTSSSTTVTPSSMSGIAMGDVINSANVPRGTTVTGIGAGTITMSAAATATASGTSATMMEPVIVFDGTFSGSGTPITVTNSSYKVNTGTPAAETWYTEAWGSYFTNSTGWKLYPPAGGDIQYSANATGDIYVPALGSYSYPLVSSGILGYIHDAAGNTYINAADIGGAGTYYPVMVSAENTATQAYAKAGVNYSQTTGVFTVPKLAGTSGVAGGGTVTYTLGSSAVVGTGATAPACATSHVCDMFSGEFSFTTGTGTSAGGNIVTVNFPVTRTNIPNCTVNAFANNSGNALAVTSTQTTSTLAIGYNAGPLTASYTWFFQYVCGGI